MNAVRSLLALLRSHGETPALAKSRPVVRETERRQAASRQIIKEAVRTSAEPWDLTRILDDAVRPERRP